MKNEMTPQQKEEVRLLLKRELFRQGIRHPRVPWETIEEMKFMRKLVRCLFMPG